MSQALWMRLREIDWRQYKTSTGGAERIPKILQDLASRKRPRAMRACHDIWKQLCGGGIHSAAAPAITFLTEIADTANIDIKFEICDTILACATSLKKIEADTAPEDLEPWHADARSSLNFAKQDLTAIAERSHGDLRITLDRTIAEL